jgi:hypothetical protein
MEFYKAETGFEASQRWLRLLLPFRIQRHVVRGKSIDVSVENVASIFKVESRNQSERTWQAEQANNAEGEGLLATCFQAGILLGLFFDSDDVGEMFLRNVGRLSTDYTVISPKKHKSSETGCTYSKRRAKGQKSQQGLLLVKNGGFWVRN